MTVTRPWDGSGMVAKSQARTNSDRHALASLQPQHPEIPVLSMTI